MTTLRSSLPSSLVQRTPTVPEGIAPGSSALSCRYKADPVPDRTRRHRFRIGRQGGDVRTPSPRHGVAADRQAQLDDPVLGDRQRRLETSVGIVVESVGQRVHVGVVVRRQLGLDIRNGDEAAKANVQPQHYRKVEVDIGHRKVDAVDAVFIEQLPAEQAIGRGVTIIDPVQGRKAEAPIEVIVLNRVGQAFDIDHGLVELERIGRVVVGGRRIAARLHRVGAEIGCRRDPAVDLNVGIAHRFTQLRVGNRNHQRAVDRIGPGDADNSACRRRAIR